MYANKNKYLIQTAIFATSTWLGYRINNHQPSQKPAVEQKKPCSRLVWDQLGFIHAAAHGTSTDIETYGEKHDAEFFANMTNLKTCNGNTVLHITAENNDNEALATMLSVLGNNVSIMAKTSNNQGTLPILVNNPRIKDAANQLLAITAQHENIKPMSEEICLEDIIACYPYEAHNEQILNNIKVAVTAINKTRKIIQHSSTHLSTNTFSQDQLQELQGRVNYLRTIARFERTINRKIWNKEQSLNIVAKHIMLHKAGNCFEYAVLTAKFIHELDQSIFVEVFQVTHSFGESRDGHVMVVLGRDRNVSLEDYTHWGDSAVICDAQNGDIFLARDIPHKLKSWVRLYNGQQMLAGIQVNFNPRHHKITLA